MAARVAPPEPCLPIPSARQLAWQRRELIGFVHYTVNAFTGREWGDGSEDPAIFNPLQLDARQWARAFAAGGFQMVILTCKHHDGFCLWPSAQTRHSVASSPWQGGRGDLVRDFSEACRAEGLDFGVYLSPWDRNQATYGDSPAYNAWYLAQLRELLTHYGPLGEVWFDGACGEGPNGRRQVYDFPAYHALVRELQPGACLFSDAGPDVRWVGNERGYASDPNWSTLNRDTFGVGATNEGQTTGHLDGTHWVPAEADVSIRPGWFYHAEEDDQVKSVAQLLEIYYHSVGLNSVLLLNLPPDQRGLVHEIDVARLAEFRAAREAIFATDLAAGASASADPVRGQDPTYGAAQVLDDNPETCWATPDEARSGWLQLTLPATRRVDQILLQEPIALGQRVKRFVVEVRVGGAWQTAGEGQTIGYKRILRFAAQPVEAVRVRILESRACPLLSRVALYATPL
ncbi:MAG: alpha-L-fucosidase [Fimbriimonadaceae bacterium]|nr:alpha-L-fucosidase [Fimbriimonadaceae bacterium]